MRVRPTGPLVQCIFYNYLSKVNRILYSYLVGYCPISDLFGKGEPILGDAYASPDIGSSLPNKSDIGQAADQTTVLLFPPRMLILPIIQGNYFKSLTSPSCTIEQKQFQFTCTFLWRSISRWFESRFKFGCYR